MKRVLLHGAIGGITIVDDEDYHFASSTKWYNSNGYAATMLYVGGGVKNRKQRRLALHRLILERKLDRPLRWNELVDHVNCDRLDNRRANLRLTSHSMNLANKRRGSNNTTGYKGVYYLKIKPETEMKRWQAYVKRDGVRLILGNYATKEEAAYVYDQAALQLFGEFAYTNLL